MEPTQPDTPPRHLDVDRAQGLTIHWDEVVQHTLSVALLRRHSPSADMRELRAEMKRNPFTVVPSSTAAGPLRIEAVEPIGHYAVRIRVSDGHDTGIYTWRYLRELCAAHVKPS
jgi:DUF971 family protein